MKKVHVKKLILTYKLDFFLKELTPKLPDQIEHLQFRAVEQRLNGEFDGDLNCLNLAVY